MYMYMSLSLSIYIYIIIYIYIYTHICDSSAPTDVSSRAKPTALRVQEQSSLDQLSSDSHLPA